jgi:putative ABC transport system permease protein
MKFLPLIWAGLWRKPMRTVFTLLAVITAFVLFGVLENVADGFRRIEASSHEDMLIVTGAFSKRITIAAVDQVRRVPGVVRTAHVAGLFGTYKDPKLVRGVNFVDDGYFDVMDDVVITRAQRDELARTRDGIVVMRAMAQEFDLKIGDRFNLTAPPSIKTKDGANVWGFQIVGIVDNVQPDARYAIGNYAYYDELRANPTVGAIFAKISDPKEAVRIGKQIDKIFQNSDTPTRTGSQRSFMQSGLGSLGNVHFLVNAVALGVMFMLLFLTANVLMQSVRERAPEFAVLTILGFSNEGVLALVVAEAIGLCLMGAAIGLVIAAVGAAPLISVVGVPHTPTLTLHALGLAVLAATVVGALSCVMPLWRLRRMTTVDVLAGR